MCGRGYRISHPTEDSRLLRTLSGQQCMRPVWVRAADLGIAITLFLAEPPCCSIALFALLPLARPKVRFGQCLGRLPGAVGKTRAVPFFGCSRMLQTSSWRAS